MHIRRELLLALFHYAVFCGAIDNDAALPVRKRSERRHFSSLRGGPSDAYAADDFDPYMGLPRELRADTDRSLSYMSYISGSMSMGKVNPIPGMSYDIDFPTPSPGVPVPNVLVETVTTPNPTSAPTTSSAPTDALFTPCEDPDLVPLEVEMITDNWVKEDATSLVLVDADTEVVVLSYGVDDPMKKFTTYNDALCVPKGKYLLTISDSLGGLDGEGTGWSVKIKGVEILDGKRFEGTSISYTILAGYEVENMTETDMKWLDEHNGRRRTFHREHNTTFKELVWSEGLYQSAMSSAVSITPTCKPANDINKGDGWGYNAIVVKKAFENPDVIGPKNSLVSWVDRAQNRDPPGSTFYSAMWRATRYIGCATLVEQMDPESEGAIDKDGNLLYCHVSICKYARPGSCDVNGENWLEKTLADRSGCGESCPMDGCY